MGSRKGREKAFHAKPVHLEIERNGVKTTTCGKQDVVLSPRRQDVTCRACLRAIAPSWWRLQIEHRPGEWIDTPTVKRTAQRPKEIRWRLSLTAVGKPTRWMNVGDLAEWGDR